MVSPTPRRVFLSHTPELRQYPADRSFVTVAESAVKRAGDIPIDTEFPLSDAEILVLIAGFHYGRPAPERPELSVAELEFETAGKLGLPRLIFLLSEEVVGPARLFIDPEYGTRQLGFRRRLAETERVDFVSAPEDLARAIQRALRDVRRPRRASRQGRRVWNLPHRVSGFVGREEILGKLVATTGPRVLEGFGGVGKTAVALEHAYRNSDRYDVAWWVPSTDTERITGALTELAIALGLASQADEADDAVRALGAELRTRGRWLLVFDDVVDPAAIEPFLSRSGDVLITTRRNDLAGRYTTLLRVDPLTRSESIALLRSLHAGLSRDEASQLSTVASGLPLALRIIAAHLKATGSDPREYLDQLSAGAATVLQGQRNPELRASAQAGMVLVFDDLGAQHPAALQLLTLIAWLGREPVPLSVITEHPEVLPPPLARVVADPLALAELTAQLGRVGLAVLSPESLTIHSLAAELLRLRTEDEEPPRGGWAAIAVRLMRAVLPAYSTEKPAARKVWGQLLGHVLAVTNRTRRLDSVAGQAVWLLDQAARCLDSQGARDRARELRERATAWLRTTSANSARNTLADLEDEFERLSERLGRDDPETLAAATNLALALQELGRYREASALHEEVVERRRRVLGDDRPETLAAATNFAVALREQGEYDRAIALHEEVFQRSRAMLGNHDPATLAAATNLAVALREVGDYSRARHLDEQTLDGSQLTLGEFHPRTLVAATSLAADLSALGDHERARALNEDTLARQRRILGEDHPDTLVSATNLAATLSALGYHQRARNLDEDTTTRYRRTLGDDHPDTLLSMNNLAADYRVQGDFERARALDESTLASYRRVLGPEHPDTLRSAGNLALDLRELGEFEQAQALVEDTLAYLRGVLGPDHPQTRKAAEILVTGERAP